MGQCLGKPKKNVKSKSIAQPKIYQSREADDTLEDKRRKAAEAAEKRQQKHTNKGVISNGKLSKNIEKQKSIGPGRNNEYYEENRGLDPSAWN